MIALQWQQHIYGVSYPLLASDKPFIEYGNSKWLNNFTQLLRKHNIQIKLKDFEPPIAQRENDVCIMDTITQKINSKLTLQRINACLLFLQITLLSEITSANGKFIKLNILNGQRNSNASTKIWPRQKTPDEATWKLWRALIKRIYCSYDNTISRQSQLGAWKCKSNQLARKYRFLYSPALHEIYDKQGKKIVSWFATDAKRTAIEKNVDSQDVESSIPADAHPIKHIKKNKFYIKRIHETTPSNNQPLSLIDFITSKPEWQRLLIENFKENPNAKSLLQCLIDKDELIIASDGSKTRTKSGGGWVIATKDGTIIIRGANPDFGQLGKMHSYRSEVYASLASQLFIKIYADYFNNNKLLR